MAPRTSRRHRRIRHCGQADDTDGSERNCTRLREADNFADKQTTQTAARGISTRLQVATVERSQRQGQRTQFVRLGRRTSTNERTNDRKTIALRKVKLAVYLYHVPTRRTRIPEDHNFAVEGRVSPAGPVGRFAKTSRHSPGSKLQYYSDVARTAVLPKRRLSCGRHGGRNTVVPSLHHDVNDGLNDGTNQLWALQGGSS
jgi:hypothetical protein